MTGSVRSPLRAGLACADLGDPALAALEIVGGSVLGYAEELHA